MATTVNKASQSLVLAGQPQGHTVISLGTPLTRLNYFDGKFLRAADLEAEQNYLRQLVALSNQAGGAGLVRGFDCLLASDKLEVGEGLAVDPAGRVLLLPQKVSVGIAELLEKSKSNGGSRVVATPGPVNFGECEIRSASQPGTVVQASQLYLITIGHAEAYCGEEDVYGKLCEAACVTGTDRPYLVEGLVIRARPLTLGTPLATSSAVALNRQHLRSLLAAAYFADERLRCGSLISQAGLATDPWCLGARAVLNFEDLPIALLAHDGSAAVFLDAWVVRRERMESPPRHYWACRMAMRPWNVFLAQVLQFQCQLRHCLGTMVDGSDDDPCREARLVAGDTARLLADFIPHYAAVSERIARAIQRDPELAIGMPTLAGAVNLLESVKARSEAAAAAPTGAKSLIQCGMVELPSAGYLPVMASRTVSVNQQVRGMMGKGVDLRFCIVRPDYVAHALEEAQHMDRISLIEGLDDPNRKPRVDVLIPNGEIRPVKNVSTGTGYEMRLDLFSPALRLLGQIVNPPENPTGGTPSASELIRNLLRPGLELTFRGAARGEATAGGGCSFHFAGSLLEPATKGPPAFTLVDLRKHSAIWSSMETDRDPFGLNRHESTRLSAELALLFAGSVFRLQLSGNLQIVDSGNAADSERQIRAQVSGSLMTHAFGPAAQTATPRVVMVNDEVTLVRRSNGATHPTFEVLLPRPSLLGPARNLFLFRTIRQWNSPTDAAVDGALQPYKATRPAAPSFTLVEIPGPMRFFHADQKANPEALTSGHPAHESAITSVRAIGAVLGEAQFDDIAVRKLFPPPRPVSSEMVILAREDWVLFHRRRDKQCTYDQPPTSAVQSRKYRLYHIPLQKLADREELDRALKTNDGGVINRFAPQPVSVVQFAAGIHTLESSVDQVRADWQTRVTGAVEIVYRAVASRGAALDEGLPLAQARLGSLSSALDTVTPLLDVAPLEVLENVADASFITAEPHDGVMIVATASAATDCHEVYRLALNQEQVEEFLNAIGGTGAEEILTLLTRREAQRLGKAVFRKGSDTLVPSQTDNLSSAWQAGGNGNVGQIVVISQRPASLANPTSEEQALIAQYQQQALRVAGQVGVSVQVASAMHRPPEDAGPIQPCPAITLLITNPTTPGVQVVRHELFWFPTPLIFSALRSQIETSGIPRGAATANTSLGVVEFEMPANESTEESLKAIERIWRERSPRDIDPATIQFFSVSQRGATEEEQKRHRVQTDSIQRVLVPQAKVATMTSGGESFPTNEPVVTLAVFQQRIG